MEFKIKKGIVTSIEDPDELGRVQVRIIPDLVGVKDDTDLPWLRPFLGFHSASNYSIDLPEVETPVWVVIADKVYKELYWISDIFFNNIFDFNDIATILQDVGLDDTYQDLTFRFYKDGGLTFHNNNDGSHGFVHNTGNSSYWDADGKIFTTIGDTEISLDGEKIDIDTSSDITIVGGAKITIEGSDTVEIKNGSGTISLNGTTGQCSINGHLTVDA